MKKPRVPEGSHPGYDSPWQETLVEEPRFYRLSLGPLRLWLQREGLEWYLAREYVREQAEEGRWEALPENFEPPELPWQRWVTAREETLVRFQPGMPLRAVVLRPDQPLRLSAGSQIRIFVPIPVHVCIRVGGADPVTLDTLPTRILSNTWFGEPAAGELCYALTSPAVRKIDGLISGPHEAVCPVTIINKSAGELDFQRLCIRVEHLGIYRGISRLWTNSMRVEYRGETGEGQISIAGKAPDFEKVEEKLVDARRPAKKTLMTKSFHLFKSLSGF
jgi:hypothetical protein